MAAHLFAFGLFLLNSTQFDRRMVDRSDRDTDAVSKPGHVPFFDDIRDEARNFVGYFGVVFVGLFLVEFRVTLAFLI